MNPLPKTTPKTVAILNDVRVVANAIKTGYFHEP